MFLLISGLAAVAQAAPKNARPAVGRLKVSVPAGVIGDNYWIYLDGRLKSAPPHGAAKSNYFMAVSSGDADNGGLTGWQFFTSKGAVLSIRHEEYDSRFDAYINSGDELQIFHTTEYPLSPGQHTVDVAMHSFGRATAGAKGSFPFAITRKYVVEVRSGQTLNIYTGVPDDWEMQGVILGQARMLFCNSPTQSLPDLGKLRLVAQDYTDDPMVKMLRKTESSLSRPKGVVVLDLPAALGGPREFDGGQINSILAAILQRHQFPSQGEIERCQRLNTEYSKVWAQYGKMIAVVEEDIASFNKLAADLKRPY